VAGAAAGTPDAFEETGRGRHENGAFPEARGGCSGDRDLTLTYSRYHEIHVHGGVRAEPQPLTWYLDFSYLGLFVPWTIRTITGRFVGLPCRKTDNKKAVLSQR